MKEQEPNNQFEPRPTTEDGSSTDSRILPGSNLGRRKLLSEEERQRELAVIRYVNALDWADLDTVAEVLKLAEGDARRRVTELKSLVLGLLAVAGVTFLLPSGAG